MITSDEKIIRYKNGKAVHLTDTVICEEWMNLYYNGTLIYQTPILNRDINDLIKGVLFTTGHIGFRDKISITQKNDDFTVEGPISSHGCPIQSQVNEDLKDSSPDSTAPEIDHEKMFDPDKIQTLMNEFNNLPSVYHETGSAHMAALAKTTIIHWADDVSRRNSTDKVIGKGLEGEIDFTSSILLSSGRISSDIIMRMINCGIPLIVSVSAPMDKAIRLAEKRGITICGFAREGRMNIYSHPERILKIRD